MNNTLREVYIFAVGQQKQRGWFHRWVNRKVFKKVPGYDKSEGFVPMERIEVIQALIELSDGSVIYADPGNINFKNQPK